MCGVSWIAVGQLFECVTWLSAWLVGWIRPIHSPVVPYTEVEQILLGFLHQRKLTLWTSAFAVSAQNYFCCVPCIHVPVSGNQRLPHQTSE